MEENLEAIEKLERQNLKLKEALQRIEIDMAKMQEENEKKLDYFVDSIDILTNNVDMDNPNLKEELSAAWEENIKMGNLFKNTDNRKRILISSG